MSTAHHLLPDADEFARMETALFDRLERGHRRKIVTHRLAAAGVVVLLSGGTVAAATVANAPSQANLAYCYPTADGSGNRVSISTAITEGAATSKLAGTQSQAARVANATARCDAAWRAGVFSASGTALKTSPRLQACITNNQVIAVYPNRKSVGAEDFCNALGLGAP